MTARFGDPAVSEEFDRLCRAVDRQGRGLSLVQLGDAHGLARELCSPDPDPDHVAFLRRRLGLTDADR